MVLAANTCTCILVILRESSVGSNKMEAIINTVSQRHVDYTLKKEQTQALCYLLDHQNVFICLPTGFGKTDIFMLLPVIQDEVHQVLGVSLTILK